MRVVFKELKEFGKWVQEIAKPDKYYVYITEENEIVLVPSKSTRPMTFAYVRVAKEEELKILTTSFEGSGYKVFNVKAFDWHDDRPVGMKFMIE